MKSYRLKFNFWLDTTKSDENEIVKTISGLKKERSFTAVVRDGIRLICDLRDGNLDVLFELFPWVRAEFLKYMEDVQPKSVEAALAPDVEKYLQEILEKLDKPQATPTGLQPLTQNSSGLKQLGGLQPIAPPNLDIDDIELTVKEATYSGSATQNLLKTFQNIHNYKN